MTEQEMRNRIKEIDKERNNLKKERKEIILWKKLKK